MVEDADMWMWMSYAKVIEELKTLSKDLQSLKEDVKAHSEHIEEYRQMFKTLNT